MPEMNDSTIRDNHAHGAVGDFLKDVISTSSEISIVSAYFTIYAYHHGKLYHVRQASGIEKAIAGSSNFTVNGLGLGGSKNIELNLIIDSDWERRELKAWFDAIWNDATGLVEDVKAEVYPILSSCTRRTSRNPFTLKRFTTFLKNF